MFINIHSLQKKNKNKQELKNKNNHNNIRNSYKKLYNH